MLKYLLTTISSLEDCLFRKNTFEAYLALMPHIHPCKLLRIGVPVYLMLCEDSNGESEIVALCIIASEDATSIIGHIENS